MRVRAVCLFSARRIERPTNNPSFSYNRCRKVSQGVARCRISSEGVILVVFFVILVSFWGPRPRHLLTQRRGGSRYVLHWVHWG
jgi:hypothetical protein